MSRTPRITVTISDLDKALLEKCLKNLGINSSGQLLSMLVSGDVKKLEWIFDGFKKVNSLF